MAERMAGTELGPAAGSTGRESPYPLHEWMDGSVWRIWRDEDFAGTLRLMRCRLYYYAASRGTTVQTRTVRDGAREGLLFQFQPDASAPALDPRADRR